MIWNDRVLLAMLIVVIALVIGLGCTSMQRVYVLNDRFECVKTARGVDCSRVWVK